MGVVEVRSHVYKFVSVIQPTIMISYHFETRALYGGSTTDDLDLPNKAGQPR